MKINSLGIKALQQILKQTNQGIETHLQQLDVALSAIPDPFNADIEKMIGEIVVVHEANPVIALSSVSSLMAGATSVLKYVDLGSQ